MPIELRHLRYVIAAAENLSFRKAAKSLGVQQSALSRRIRDLEDEIGVALFIRHHGGVHLTQAGQRFLVRARRALMHVGEATYDAASFGRGEQGVVRIGIFSSLAAGFLGNLLRAYVAAHPAAQPILIEGGPAEHIAAIRRRDLDIAFLTGRPVADGSEWAHFWDERVYVALPTDHHLISKSEISWKDLQGQNFIVSETDPGPEIHDYLVKHLADLGLHPSIERHGVGRDNLMHLVAMGQGLTVVHEAAVVVRFPGIDYRPLKDEILPFCAIWSPLNDNPALRRLLSLTRTMSKAVLAG